MLLLACVPAQPEVAQQGASHDTAAVETGVGDSGRDTSLAACDELPPLPVEAGYLSGFQGSEDFAFDDDGFLVGLDTRGNILGINQAGDQKVIVTKATRFGAGMRFLPGGDLVFADAEKGNLTRVNPSTGVLTVVLSGLSYPNGLDVGTDGLVYVSEQNAGRVRWIDPDSGEFGVVGTGFYNPNGVTFSVGYDTLYVGSFGAGVAWAIDRDGSGWAEPRVYATTPNAPGEPPDWCATYGEGSDCPSYGGYGLGTCAEDDLGEVSCTQVYDTAACDGVELGAACTTSRLDTPVDSVCSDGPEGVFCPSTGEAFIAACDGSEAYAACNVHGVAGTCYPTAEGVIACYDWSTYVDAMATDCIDKAEGEACVIDHEVLPGVGLCGDGSAWGLGDNVCLPGGVGFSEYGGLDGINVDACDNLYVTEYIQGKVWRFATEGSDAEMVTKLRSSWIPNLHWGNGVGGWDTGTLYVMDRDRKGVFTLDLGVQGHGDAYQPGG